MHGLNIIELTLSLITTIKKFKDQHYYYENMDHNFSNKVLQQCSIAESAHLDRTDDGIPLNFVLRHA